MSCDTCDIRTVEQAGDKIRANEMTRDESIYTNLAVDGEAFLLLRGERRLRGTEPGLPQAAGVQRQGRFNRAEKKM